MHVPSSHVAAPTPLRHPAGASGAPVARVRPHPSLDRAKTVKSAVNDCPCGLLSAGRLDPMSGATHSPPCEYSVWMQLGPILAARSPSCQALLTRDAG